MYALGPTVILTQKKARLEEAGYRESQRFLHRVVHLKLDWVSGHIQALNLTFFQLDIGVDHVIGEYTTGGKETAVLIEGGK